jgi:hypothetical protein
MAKRKRPVEEPEELEQDEDEEQDEEELEAAPPAPDPNAEAIKALRADLDAEKAERFRLEGEVRASRATRDTRPEPDEVLTDAEIDEGIAAGGARARAVMEKAARIEAKKVAKAYEATIADLTSKVDGYGMPALARHEQHIASQGLTFFADYKDEIEKRLGQLPLATRTQPEAVRQIYALVAGEHLDEIVERRVNEALKKANGSPGVGGPTNIRGRGQGDTTLPSASELLGEAEARRIAEKGGEEQFAKKMGLSGWAEFVELSRGEARGNA